MSAFVIVLIILLAIKYLPGLLSEVFLGPSGIFLWMMVSVVAVAFICIFIDKKIKLHNSRRKRNWSKNKNRRDYKVDHKKIKQDMINHKLEEEKKGLEKERERNISIVESDPPTPVLIEISTNTDFSCKEEEKINIHLRKYSHLKNQINETESMLNYLKQKYAALTALGRQEEAQNVEIELNSQETTLREYQMYENTDSYIFKSELNDIFFNDNEIRDYYCKFIQAIGPRVSFSTYMSDFFSEDYMYMINVEGIMICLTPCYIVCFEPKLYHDKPIELKIVKYDSVKVYGTNDKLNMLDIYFGNSTKVQYQRYFRNCEEKSQKERAIVQYCKLMTEYYDAAIEMGLNRSAGDGASWNISITKDMQIASQRIQSNIGKETSQVKKEKTVINSKMAASPWSDFKVEDKVISAYTGLDKDVVVPKGIATSIGQAFRWKYKLNSVVLPEGIEEIQQQAFYGSSDIQSITIPHTVVTIESEAFASCSRLANITLPEGLKSISKQLFANCTSLEEIIIPKTVTSINQKAFVGCKKLRKIVIPDSVKTIGKDAFKGCASLEYIYLSNNIKTIPQYFFSGLQNLRNVTVAADITQIGRSAFADCHKLQRLCTPDSNILIFDRLERIEDKAFYNCKSFEGFDIWNQVTHIGESAFAGCESLKNIKVGDEVDWHRKSCFNGTPWLKDHAENGYVIDGDYLENYVGEDEMAVIPKGVKTIGRGAFYKNKYIKEVKMPNSVNEIETFAFANCKKLLFVNIPDSVSKISDTAFFEDKNITIRCSRGSIASKFRIEHKIKCEYVSKAASAGRPDFESGQKKRTRKASSTSAGPAGLSGLSEEEYQVIMEMRRKKLIEKQEGEKKAYEPETITYSDAVIAKDKVGLTLVSDSRVITNNIFNIQFTQTEPVSANRGAAEYEVFVADKNGKIISNIEDIKADKTGDDMTCKVTLTLLAHGDFDKEADYFVMLRYKGGGTQILSSIPYKINIEFAAEFDF